MQAWNMFKNESLVELVDETFREDLDFEEASRFFKIALLCMQEVPKLRPLMSTVVAMLQGEVDITEMSITQPGMLCEFTDIKAKEISIEHTDKSTSAFVSLTFSR